MQDTFNNELNIGDRIVFMHQWYDGRWESFHKGTIIGFTECFVKIKVDKEDEKEYWARNFVQINGAYQYMQKPYIMRQPHKLIKI